MLIRPRSDVRRTPTGMPISDLVRLPDKGALPAKTNERTDVPACARCHCTPSCTTPYNNPFNVRFG